ncbi:MAG: HEPN domain-containing protein [Patescibacteria group bacterium]
MEKIVKFWLDSSKEDLEITKDLFKACRYNYSMFMCQQSIEKFLKGIIIILTKDHPPYVHDLVRLAQATKFKISPEIETDLRLITSYYIKARYEADRFDSAIFNKENARITINRAEEIVKWFTKKANLKI